MSNNDKIKLYRRAQQDVLGLIWEYRRAKRITHEAREAFIHSKEATDMELLRQAQGRQRTCAGPLAEALLHALDFCGTITLKEE